MKYSESQNNKIKLGASLVQMYTSLTYGGPQLINKILIDHHKEKEQ